jgi:hypothetical protein
MIRPRQAGRGVTGKDGHAWPMIASSGEIASQARFYSGSFFVVMFGGWAGRMKL